MYTCGVNFKVLYRGSELDLKCVAWQLVTIDLEVVYTVVSSIQQQQGVEYFVVEISWKAAVIYNSTTHRTTIGFDQLTLR